MEFRSSFPAGVKLITGFRFTNPNAFGARLIPVSYTHLDVYKRQVYNEDYGKIFEMCEENDFVFLDPPYDCTFTDYGNKEYKDGFNEEEHLSLIHI